MTSLNAIVAFALSHALPGRGLVCGSGPAAPAVAKALQGLQGVEVLQVLAEPPLALPAGLEFLLLADPGREDGWFKAAAAVMEPRRILRSYSHPGLAAWVRQYGEDLVAGDGSAMTASHAGCVTRCTLELSDRCNLRCIYCHQNFPPEHFTPYRSLAPDQLAETIAFFSRNRVAQVAITGGGETTLHPGWEQAVDALAAAGCQVTMTTNLSRRYSPAELETLLRFANLDVSLDSFDPEVMTRVRKGSNFHQIIGNIAALRTEVLSRGLAAPTLSLSAVVYAEMAAGFGKLIAFAALMGIRVVHLQDFVNYGLAADNVTSLWSLRGDAARAAFAAMCAGLDDARARGIQVKIGSGLGSRLAAVRAFLAGGSEADLERDLGPNREGWAASAHAWAPDPADPQTRDCTDPWDTLQIFGDATARVCCFHASKFGPFDSGRPIEGLWNGEVATAIRRGLLSGDLDDSCRHCNMRGLTSPEALRRKVQAKYFS